MSEAGHVKRNKRGYIRVIAGGMFSGKSEKGFSFLKRALVSKRKLVAVFTPDIASRVVTIHDSNEQRSSARIGPVYVTVTKGIRCTIVLPKTARMGNAC